MNAPLPPSLGRTHALADSVAEACRRIAPTWPLDRLIAVNPHWGWVDQPIECAAAHLGALGGGTLLWSRDGVRAEWRAGRLRHEHLAAVAARPGAAWSADALAALLDGNVDTPPPPPLAGAADLRDVRPDPSRALGWRETVVHQTSQHCAAWFDAGQAGWHLDRRPGLLGSWRGQLAEDRGLAWRLGRRWLRARLQALPAEPLVLIGAVLDTLGLPPAGRTAYLTSRLLGLRGWAAWCAHERWQARLRGGDDDVLVELLAVLVAWEGLLAEDAAPGTLPTGWAERWAAADTAARRQAEALSADWALQAALEEAYRAPLCAALRRAPPAPPPAAAAQAVFCIDVRSERLRRALEAVDPAVHTRGFAGFFGLPVAYTPLGSALARPQLPGLLAPAATVVDAVVASPDGATTSGAAGGHPIADTERDDVGAALGQLLAARRRARLGWRQRWDAMRSTAGSGFSFVETCGLLYAHQLARGSWPGQAADAPWDREGLPEGAALRPTLAGIDASAGAEMAHGILGAMGLTGGFAPIVLLVGHGSRSANNPHAASLDCGACGGQTGEVNARALAGLLNDPPVRHALAVRGVAIPEATCFVPALHDTMTDEVQLFDIDVVPPALQPVLKRLRDALAAAGARVRRERAPALGLSALGDDALADSLRRRANDWAQVRPEWGLADNAAFVVAPRARTRGLDLGGRCFLHDYDWHADDGGRVLELIMTAPMIVTHWINAQYHASTVDPQHWGSGSKLLHNVVGGGIGVFEGNGGDLRIGLPWQSVHDGERLRHTPLRLAVFIEAPRAMIDAVIGRHETVRQLVEHGWLALYALEGEAGAAPTVLRRRRAGSWVAA